MSTRVEICVDTIDCAQSAARAGADRIELCGALGIGGLTPPAGMMTGAAALATPVRALIRPRDGDFRYGAADVALMRDDVLRARDAGLEGVVIGALTPGGALDIAALERLIAAAGGMGLTLHRAFDMCADPFEALEQAVDLGFDHILTSGQAQAAIEGTRRIAELVARADGRITVMPGGGITPHAVAALIAATGANAIHASCARSRPAPALSAFGFAPAGGIRRFDPATLTALRAAMAEPVGETA